MPTNCTLLPFAIVDYYQLDSFAICYCRLLPIAIFSNADYYQLRIFCHLLLSIITKCPICLCLCLCRFLPITYYLLVIPGDADCKCPQIMNGTASSNPIIDCDYVYYDYVYCACTMMGGLSLLESVMAKLSVRMAA